MDLDGFGKMVLLMVALEVELSVWIGVIACEWFINLSMLQIGTIYWVFIYSVSDSASAAEDINFNDWSYEQVTAVVV